MSHVRKIVRTYAAGKQYTRYQARWTDSATRKPRARRFTSRRAAEAWLRRVEVAAATGEPVEPDPAASATLGEWLAGWVDSTVVARLNSGTWSPTHAAAVEMHVRVHITPRLGHLRLAQLDVEHVEADLIDAMIADGLAPATARKSRSVLSRALTDARRRGHVRFNAAREAEPPAVDEPEPSSFSPDELTAIVGAWGRTRYAPLFEFILYTGLRLSEARGLRWSDVDLEGGSYRIARGLGVISRKSAGRLGIVDHRHTESTAKTKASRTRTGLSRAAVELLRSHRQAQLEERMAATSWADQDVVWATGTGAPISPEAARRAWRQVLEAAGVEPERDGRLRGPQELRRTFTTRLRDAGVPLEDVQRLGRWASPRVLLAHYAASSSDRLRAAAEKAAKGIG